MSLPAPFLSLLLVGCLSPPVAEQVQQHVFDHVTDDARVLEPHDRNVFGQVRPPQEIIGTMAEVNDAA